MKKQMCSCQLYVFNYFSTVGGEVPLLSVTWLFELMPPPTHTHTWVFLGGSYCHPDGSITA